eukprot:9000593-Karenia_brevis.AAC.1
MSNNPATGSVLWPMGWRKGLGARLPDVHCWGGWESQVYIDGKSCGGRPVHSYPMVTSSGP